MKATVFPSQCGGTVTIPPSKSMAHRAIICAALAAGKSSIHNIAYSQDIKATIGAMEQLGATVSRNGDALEIIGVGNLPGLQNSSLAGKTIHCEESGSTLRFLIPLCSLTLGNNGQGKPLSFTGKGRLLERPQTVYQALFAEQGVGFRHTTNGIWLDGSLQPGSFTLPGDISSQFVTGLLLTLPLLPADSIIQILPPVESRSYIALTLQTMADFGVTAHWQDETTLCIPGNQAYQAKEYRVEGDYSQLAFFAVLAAVNQPITCLGVRHDSRQGDKVILDIVQQFGAKVREVSGGYTISPGTLIARPIDLADCPDLGPVLTVLACFSRGQTKIYNAGRLRIKESDRIAAMETELAKLGFAASSTQDTILVEGNPLLPGIEQAITACHNDHRIAMSLAVLASSYQCPVVIAGAEAVNKSYPSFFEDLQAINGKVVLEND